MIDRTDDYKARSSAGRVLEAVHRAFGQGTRQLPSEALVRENDEPLCAEC